MAKRAKSSATKEPRTRKKAAKAPPAGKKAQRRTATPSRARKSTREIRVRMYRQGLGDCFLISVPKPDGDPFFILIDCGVILGTPNAKTVMEPVVADILATTQRHVDLLVVTHEHWDHLSGFDQFREQFDRLAIDQVWLAWTEDPHDATAQRLRQQRGQRLAALWVGFDQLRNHPAEAGTTAEALEAREGIDRAAQVLSFFGIDPGKDSPPAGLGLGVAATAAVGKTAAAMEWARTKTDHPRFCRPGELIELPGTGGVRAFVLGPPTDLTQLFKDLPTRSGQETYDAAARLAAAESTFFAAAFPAHGPTGSDPSLPFDAKYRVEPEAAAGIDFFREHYFGAGADDVEAWRRIEADWTAGAADLALQLDSDTNNTSLALAFELPDGRVLLFPGDAQVGNWESWHADSQGKPRVWKVGDRAVTAADLLNRTVLYKVGHHGSHNATLRAKGLELMIDKDLVAMVPVDTYVAHVKKRWGQMPFNPLMDRLREVTQGRVVQADVTAKPFTTGPASVQDAEEKIKVETEGGKTVERPLYVDFILPL